MKNKFIIVVAGEPKSVFLEVFFKAIKYKRYKSPIILICNKKILTEHMKKNNFKRKLNILKLDELKKYKLNNICINLINVKFSSGRINQYLNDSFRIAFKLIKDKLSIKLINGPINKSSFLNKKYLGVTCMSSDFLDLTPRDEYIGWDRVAKTQKMINHTCIGSTIVPIQPLVII